MIFSVPELGDLELRVIQRIEALKKTLGYAVSVPLRWSGLLRRITFARAIRGSNSIEGYNVTVDDALAAAEGEEPLDASAEAWMAVTGYRSAMTYVLQLAQDPHFLYSADLLRALHFMMLQYDLSKNPGRWRPGPVFVRDEEKGVVVYEGADVELVPSLIQEMVSELNVDHGAVFNLVRAAMGHLNLVMIHPFSDGNGRMARCLQTLILARTGSLAPPFSSIEEYLGRNTRAYYDVLQEVGGAQWQPKRDALPWLRFCLKAHFQQATTLLRRTKEMHRLWDSLEEEIHRRRLPERTIYALSDAAMGLRVRNATYRSVAQVTDQIASRDLKLLVDHALLLPDGERRGRSYVASEAIKTIRVASRIPKTIEDPFVETPSEVPYLPGLEPRDRGPNLI